MAKWTEEEFEKLRTNPDLSDQEMIKGLPGRSVDAIEIVRNGLHAYHLGQDISMLFEIMTNRLQESERTTTCPKCGQVF